MNTLQKNTANQTHSTQHTSWLKTISLWIVPLLTIILIFVAQTDTIFADDDCKTATGQCSTSIGLYVG